MIKTRLIEKSRKTKTTEVFTSERKRPGISVCKETKPFFKPLKLSKEAVCATIQKRWTKAKQKKNNSWNSMPTWRLVRFRIRRKKLPRVWKLPQCFKQNYRKSERFRKINGCFYDEKPQQSNSGEKFLELNFKHKLFGKIDGSFDGNRGNRISQ